MWYNFSVMIHTFSPFVRQLLRQIGDREITFISISNTVTGIASNSFQNMFSLKQVKLPEEFKEIVKFVFGVTRNHKQSHFLKTWKFLLIPA